VKHGQINACSVVLEKKGEEGEGVEESSIDENQIILGG
jgi:hypothetical protein